MIISTALVQLISIITYFANTFKRLKKLQKRFTKKIEKGDLLEHDEIAERRKKRMSKGLGTAEDIYDKYDKKNQNYIDKISKLQKDEQKKRAISVDQSKSPYGRSKSTNQASNDWYRKWQNKQSADFEMKIDVRAADKSSLGSRSRKGSEAGSRRPST